MVFIVRAGDMGINLAQLKTVEKRENGAAIVTMIGGQELALLPDEAAELEQSLRMTLARQHVKPIEMELRSSG